ncbi:unnamed protein product [Rotaria socialis]|uniref:J domain-containing protein n=1 Tax=Rotaria socialis TaxID=392032 RepID=A0A820UTC4_9BILA|nr:unnamed protein product [Rotaria socialis]CAF4490129.1 unnamed protein product [Rotaria socialis]CAF4654005.1 unnamed protein product [Rotaria socialis]
MRLHCRQILWLSLLKLIVIPRSSINTAPLIEQCWECQRELDRNECLSYCPCEKRVLLPVCSEIDYFRLFDLSRSFEIDTKRLTTMFRNKMKYLHPDLYSNKSDIEKRYSQEQSAALNGAYKTLSCPLSRAHYLLKLENITIEESSVQLEPSFLNYIMEINEDLIEANADKKTFPTELAIDIRQKIDDHTKELSNALNRMDLTKATEILARLQYFNNINDKLTQLEVKHGHTHASDCLHFSSDNQLIGSGGWDSRTILWNVITGEKVYDFHHHTSAVQSISFHPKLNLMATGSHDHVVFLYDLDNPSASQPVMLRGHFGNVRALAFSTLPYLASAGWDKVIVIWQLETNRVRVRLFGHAGWIQAITFRDDDGSILASTDDDTVRVWNIFSNDCLHRLSIVNDLSCFVRFLPNNRGVIVGGAVYELLANQWIPPRERKRTKCVREPVTGETVLMSRQKTFLPRQPHRDMSVKLPTVKPRPTTQQSILRKRITIE